MSSELDAETAYEPDLRDLCAELGWDFIDLGQRLDPPRSNTMVSLWARGLRPLPAVYAKQMAVLLDKPEDRVWRSIAEGARRYQLRLQFLAQSAPSSKPAAKRPRKTSVA